MNFRALSLFSSAGIAETYFDDIGIEVVVTNDLKVSKWHYPPVHSWKQVEWMMHTPTGLSAFKNEIFYPKTKGRKVKGAPRTYMRMDWGKPATTIM